MKLTIFKKTKKLIPMLSLLSLALSLGGYVLAQTYYVQPGDSLYRVAARYGASITDLQRLNQLKTPNLYPGQALRIDVNGRTNQSNPYNSYTVTTGDTAYLIAQRHQISLSALLSLNRLSSSAALHPGQVLQIPAASVTGPTRRTLNQSDLELLARLVTAESSGEPFVGQVAVAATILNRLQDKRYPKTIPDIIYQVNYGCYQYSPILDGRINQPAVASAYRAVEMALSGWDPSNGANGFYNPAKTDSQWVRSHPKTAAIVF
jgi:N-acetylmuramoyl-L-alanine amidase